jgi:hypothetical protein
MLEREEEKQREAHLVAAAESALGLRDEGQRRAA